MFSDTDRRTELLHNFHSPFLIHNSPAEEDSITHAVFGVRNKIPKDELPRNERLVRTLMDAANGNSNYGMSLRAKSIEPICKETQHFHSNCN